MRRLTVPLLGLALLLTPAAAPPASPSVHAQPPPPAPVPGEEPRVVLPAEVRAAPWAVIVPTAKMGGEVRWRISPELELVDLGGLFPGVKPAGIVVQGKAGPDGKVKPGRYTVLAWNAKGDVASDLAECVVVVGSPAPPGPTPPPVPPPPDDPAPIPDPGLRVLIVYESADQSAYTPATLNILFGKEMREYLVGAVVKHDGTPERRIYDKDQDLSGERDLWRNAMKVARNAPGFKTPWLLVSNGRTGFQGPLPATVQETKALIQKYQGGS